jgi:hypothetical protein
MTQNATRALFRNGHVLGIGIAPAVGYLTGSLRKGVYTYIALALSACVVNLTDN